MPNFELLYAELEDLAADDPMRPAAIVHVLGDDAQPCRDRIMTRHSIYVIGRGQLPPEVGKDGYFFVASRPDYSVLQSALADFWPDVPGFPLHLRRNEATLPVLSQETADVMNYIAKPPLHDPRIFREARKRLRGLVPKKHLVATAYATQWLVENMSPANNCYTLSALLARWLKEHGASAEYCEGHATLCHPRHPPVTIPHAWVDVNGEVCDLTVDRQGDWGDFNTSVARIRVNNSCIVYEIGGSKYGGLEAFWSVFSKPPGRPAYTEASLKRQSAMMRKAVAPALYDERESWITLVREHGILEGTYRLLTTAFEETRRAV